jgi:hypothetical protein
MLNTALRDFLLTHPSFSCPFFFFDSPHSLSYHSSSFSTLAFSLSHPPHPIPATSPPLSLSTSTHASNQAVLPDLCANGTYSLPGSSTCTLASPGYYTPTAGAVSQTQCGIGYFSTTGVIRVVVVTENTCSGSWVLSVATSLFLHLTNTLHTQNTTHTHHSYTHTSHANTTHPRTYTPGSFACTLCTPGYMCRAGSSTPSPLADACQIGGYCNPPTVYTPCPAGRRCFPLLMSLSLFFKYFVFLFICLPCHLLPLYLSISFN